MSGKAKREYTEQAYREAYASVREFAEIVYEIAKRQRLREQKLKKHPKGFHLEEDGSIYNCIICHRQISGKSGWWDKLGQKCLDCQRNIKEGVIPAEICQDDDLWIKDWQLKSDYNLHPSTTRKLRREGVLKGRDLKTKDGTIYYTVYLVSENKEFLKKYPKKPVMGSKM